MEDFGCRNEFGEFEYLGRLDSQVKVRGFRIELSEVRRALEADLSVEACAVTVVRGDGSDRLVAFVIPRTDAIIDSALRSRLQAQLPTYSMPQLVTVESLPMTPNGKLDTAALAQIPLATQEKADLSSLGELELGILELVEDVLGHGIGGRVEDSFFELGGTSLSANKLAALIREKYSKSIELATIFRHPSVLGLAAAVEEPAAQPSAFDQLLTFRESGGDTTVFCIHPGAGIGWSYRVLADEFPSDLGVVAIQARGLDDSGAQLPASMRELAEDYLRIIEAIQPDGPLSLVGWSFGGYAVHEIARLAEQRGRTVQRLVILDAFPMVDAYAALPQQSVTEAYEVLMDYLEVHPQAWDAETILGVLQESFGGELWDEDRLTAYARVSINNLELLKTFEPGRVTATTHVFAATEDVPAEVPGPESWLPHVGQVIADEVPTHHLAMLSPTALEAMRPTLRPLFNLNHNND